MHLKAFLVSPSEGEPRAIQGAIGTIMETTEDEDHAHGNDEPVAPPAAMSSARLEGSPEGNPEENSEGNWEDDLEDNPEDNPVLGNVCTL